MSASVCFCGCTRQNEGETERERGGGGQRESQISEVKLRKKQNPSRRFSLDLFHFFSLFHSVWMIIDQSTSR